MLLSWVILAFIIIGFLLTVVKRNRAEKRLQSEEDSRKALLEAILKNNKDRYKEN